MDTIAKITATKDRITIMDGDKILCDLPGELIRPVLGIVAVLVDEELPALLDKQYINANADWKHELTAMLVPSGMFSGEW
jgi:hypothetical protein